MRKPIVVIISFIFMIVFMVGCMPPTFMPPVNVNVIPGDNITDVSIAVDQNGIKHIVGIKDNQVVYFKANIGEPIYQFTIGWGILTPGVDTSAWVQQQPEIAVLDNGTAYIVWWEHRNNPDEKTACHYEVPETYDSPEKIGCVPLDTSGEYTTGFVRVVAKGNTAYAVYTRMDSSASFVDSIWYKNMDEYTSGLVVDYSVVGEEAFITSMDLAIDNNGKLHLAYIDLDLDPEDQIPRLFYRSNTTTTGTYESMSQIWEIAPGSSGLKGNVHPSIHFHKDGSDTYVMITSVWGAPNESIWIDSCTVVDCVPRAPKTPLQSNPDWDSSSEILEVKGLGTTEDYSTYALSFIAHNDVSPNYQVWFWFSPFGNNPVQVTDTTYIKSHLNMVAGSDYAPVVGFVERWEVSDPIISDFERVSIYDGLNGLREIKTNSCLATSKTKSLDMASYIKSGADFLPVAGVWNYCGTTWFTTNANLVSLPLIVK
ncbi:MAG TPA: hypothetical protein VK856_05570 [Anaerolineaceae bacterium]|nr:hypothetical protein [Anaerolineaceae bacterium]